MYDPVLEVVERSNQRGGRMLSVVDLLEAGTLNLRQAAWLLKSIEEGSSWMVGAKPGGAGKTTIMSALLAMLPPGETIRLTNAGTNWQDSRPGDCVVAYEISPGAYDAYIWGENVKRLAELGSQGCRIVTNLHADTLEEARRQIVKDNGADPKGFLAFDIFLPITMRGSYVSGYQRRIEEIYYAKGDAWSILDECVAMTEREEQIARFLDESRKSGIKTVAALRQHYLAEIRKGNLPEK